MKRAEFRHYLEVSGVMDALSRALIKLYDEPSKPENPISFVRKNFTSVNEVIDKEDKDDINNSADGLIQSLKAELDAARQEIGVLQKALDEMQKSS